MKNKVILILICLTVVIQSCSIQKSITGFDSDSYWKKEVMLNLAGKFVDYIKDRPRDSIHNYEQDIYNKFIDINRYPFGDAFRKIHNEIISHQVSFDSIICTSMQYGFGIDPEYLYPIDFSLFYNGKIIAKYNHDPEKLTLEKENDFNQEKYMILFEKMCNKIDGDDLSLIVLTKIKPDWTIEITKVIINSNPIIYDND